MKAKKWALGMAVTVLLFGNAGVLNAQSEEEGDDSLLLFQEEASVDTTAAVVETETKQLATIYFGPDEVQAFIENLAELDAAGSYLLAQKDAKLIIRGYAANAGYEGGRMEVSRQRAEYCRRYIQTRFSLAADRFQVEWFGSSRNPEKEAKSAADMRCVELIAEETKTVAPVEVEVIEEEVIPEM
jgi:outer membrane protein OmpA-like peptidoglycan-associated protein